MLAVTIVQPMEKRHIPLLDMTSGEIATVIAINSHKQAILKLHQLGIRIGVDIEVLRRAPLHGPLLVKVSNREIAIGYGLCSKIIVGVEH